MTPAYLSLLGFAAWTMLMPVLYVGLWRVPLVLARRRPANAWPRGAEHDDPPLVRRIHDAHMNCVENLPVFAAIIAVAGLTGNLETANLLGPWVLALRVGQSVTHMIGASAALVFVRGNLYLLQLALMAWMAIALVG